MQYVQHSVLTVTTSGTRYGTLSMTAAEVAGYIGDEGEGTPVSDDFIAGALRTALRSGAISLPHPVGPNDLLPVQVFPDGSAVVVIIANIPASTTLAASDEGTLHT